MATDTPTPTKMPQEVEIVFYHSIGRLINRWGYIDSLFSQLCSDLMKELGHIPKGKVPWGLTHRLNFVLECFEADWRIKNGIDAVKMIVDDVKQVDIHRGYIVHGCMTQYFPEGPRFQFTKLDRSADKRNYEAFDGYRVRRNSSIERRLIGLGRWALQTREASHIS